MKYLKLALISVAFFLIVLTLLSLLVPSHITVSRATNIDVNGDPVLKKVGDIQKWGTWYPDFDKATVVPVTEKDGRLVEATASGIKIKIDEANDTLVRVILARAKKPVTQTWRLLRFGDSATLQTQMDFDLKWYPWEKLPGFLFDRTYGPSLEQQLMNLKK